MKKISFRRIPYLPLFFAGLILGIITMNLGKSLLLQNTGFLDEYTLYHMKYMTVDSNALFLFVLRKRMKTILILGVMATTYLGIGVICGMVIWYGMSAGMFVSALVIRYGMKGVFLAITGIFPQFLLYVPGIFFLFLLCERTCRSIYVTKDFQQVPKKIITFLGIIGIIFLGCLLESFVNPFFVGKLLKIF